MAGVMAFVLAGCGQPRSGAPRPVLGGPPVVSGSSKVVPGASSAVGASAPSSAAPPLATGATIGVAALECRRDATFPATLAVAEASAAAEVELTPGAREMLVVSDSGGNGAAAAWRLPSGPARALRLPLDDAASDDLEGMAWRGGTLYTLTSSGAVREFVADGRGGLSRSRDSYRIAQAPLSCEDLRAGNCEKNFEGLCLRRAGATSKPTRCDGYAASKARSALYCVVLDRGSGRLRIDGAAPLDLPLAPNALSDCAFGAEGSAAEDVLLITTNIYGGSRTFFVDEASGSLQSVAIPGTLNNEAVAVDKDGMLYELMDDNGSPSFAARYACTGWPAHP